MRLVDNHTGPVPPRHLSIYALTGRPDLATNRLCLAESASCRVLTFHQRAALTRQNSRIHLPSRRQTNTTPSYTESVSTTRFPAPHPNHFLISALQACTVFTRRNIPFLTDLYAYKAESKLSKLQMENLNTERGKEIRRCGGLRPSLAGSPLSVQRTASSNRGREAESN